MIMFVLLLATALYTDIRYRKIPNWLNATAAATGLAVHGVQYGWSGLGGSAVGCFGCGIVVWIMYRLGAVGAGDVKLFGAIGALIGLESGLYVLWCAVMIAGFIALAVFAMRKELSMRFVEPVRKFLYMALVYDPDAVRTIGNPPGGGLRFPFMLAVAPGAWAGLWMAG